MRKIELRRSVAAASEALRDGARVYLQLYTDNKGLEPRLSANLYQVRREPNYGDLVVRDDMWGERVVRDILDYRIDAELYAVVNG